MSEQVERRLIEILGQPRIVPLYDTVTGTGNNTEYHIVGFAAVVITVVPVLIIYLIFQRQLQGSVSAGVSK